MTVYLLHFSEPISGDHTTQHYLGWSEDVEGRIAMHGRGRGCNLARVALERGIGLTLARTWEGCRSLERRLKRRNNGPRMCPVCRGGLLVGAGEDAGAVERLQAAAGVGDVALLRSARGDRQILAPVTAFLGGGLGGSLLAALDVQGAPRYVLVGGKGVRSRRGSVRSGLTARDVDPSWGASHRMVRRLRAGFDRDRERTRSAL